MAFFIGGYCIVSIVSAVMIFGDAIDDGWAVASVAFFAVLLFWPLIFLFIAGCDAYERLSTD